MLRKLLKICFALTMIVPTVMAEDVSPSQTLLSAAAIVEKNVAARGGLEAWRSVKTMSMAGKMGAGGNMRATLAVPIPDTKAGKLPIPPRPADEVQLPFSMELKRPGKLRFELQFRGQTAIQVFDGANGWKLRPFLNRNEVEPYSEEELKAASRQADLDGPLVDYAAKGTLIELIGKEKVEGRDTYKLKLTMKNGQAVHVWIDAQTFLETKIEGQPRRLDGKLHPVEVYYRDYRPIKGLQIPFVMETKVLPVATAGQGRKESSFPPEKIIVEKVVVNPNLEESRFLKPLVAVVAKSN
jgi:hypothetical protein